MGLKLVIENDPAIYLSKQKHQYNFDLMIFNKQSDYLCYVEAVHLMLNNIKLKSCNFLYNTKVFMKEQTNYPLYYD